MSEVFKLSEYQPLDYLMEHVDLEFDLTKIPVQVKANIRLSPNPLGNALHKSSITLNGQNLKLTSIALNDTPLKADEYTVTPNSLIIHNVPKRTFSLQTTTLLGENTDLFGLYVTEGILLVKAETEGMRRVFYCNDRPDNLATYKTTLIAAKDKYPVLLANGNLVENTAVTEEIHSVTWLDETPKPTYLFAVVAGQLNQSTTSFITRNDHEVAIEFYMSDAAAPKCAFAKEVIKQAMKWDEQVCDLDCELSHHKIAGVDKYASGASEPTGLNLFNTANLLASPESHTDLSFLRVLEVVAHEYFHYWTGNRVTIRDWFNLPFKEGLTTFRAAQFREELLGTDLVRLLDGKNLDERPPRYSTYTAVRSLYTAAAYEKAADIFRMIMLVMGKELFYQSLTLFLKSNDGQAVTLENFLDSISTTSRFDVRNFLPWFTESGIPVVSIMDDYDESTQLYTLNIDIKDHKSRPIPLVLGLLDQSGREILNDKLLILDQSRMTFTFAHQSSRPVPSLFRSFSAPVIVEYLYTQPMLLSLLRYDTNLYNRCEAMKNLIKFYITQYIDSEKLQLSGEFLSCYADILADPKLSHWLKAELLSLPTEEELISQFDKPEFEKIAAARVMLQKQIAVYLQEALLDWQVILENLSIPKQMLFDNFSIEDAGKRRLSKVCTSYLCALDQSKMLPYLQKEFTASLGLNMTQNIAALTLLCDIDLESANSAIEAYFQHWQNDTQALNYWFGIQAAAHSPNTVTRVTTLLQHPAFDLSNPNKVYALIGAFINNPYGFHQASGLGYELVADIIIKLDSINPALASKLAEGFAQWDKYDVNRQKIMLSCLAHMNGYSSSVDVKNSINKSLAKAPHALDQTAQHFGPLSNISKTD